jgi:hypothetical protein
MMSPEEGRGSPGTALSPGLAEKSVTGRFGREPHGRPDQPRVAAGTVTLPPVLIPGG